MASFALKSTGCDFQIRFRSLFLPDWAAAFPCDADGNVDMDRLSEAGRREYLFGRIIIRHECMRPEVVPLPAP